MRPLTAETPWLRHQKERSMRSSKARDIDDNAAAGLPETANTGEMALTIQNLCQMWSRPKDHELQRLFNKLPHLDDGARREICQSFERLTDNLFHPPLESLRAEARAGTSTELLNALVRLFRSQRL